MSETTQNASLLSRLGRWAVELILVFIGVYAAFWLNNYQQQQEQVKRRDGGIELLDVKTLTVLRQLESTVRGDLSAMAHFEKLSDELIAPNLDQDISFFYDPATKNFGNVSRNIRKRWTWW